MPAYWRRRTAMLFRLAFAFASMTALLFGPFGAVAQDMLRSVDLNSPEMSTSEMTRAEVEALLKVGVPLLTSEVASAWFAFGKSSSGRMLRGMPSACFRRLAASCS